MMEVENNQYTTIFAEVNDDEEDEEIEVEDVDVGDYIYLTSINMIVNRRGSELQGLQLIDQDENYASQYTWSRNRGSLESQKIKTDQVIIGLMCNTQSDHITRIGFILGTVPPVKLTELHFGEEIIEKAKFDQYPSPVMLPHIKFDYGYLLSEIRYKTDS